MTFASVSRENCEIQRSTQQHAILHRSFAQGVAGFNETLEKKGVLWVRLLQPLEKADSLQQFEQNKKRL
jgi:hypothetical protein